jgi:ribonucleotide reductase alpha subunit
MADDKMLAKVDFQETSLDIWASKYQLKDKEDNLIDKSIDDTYDRVATALSKLENQKGRAKHKKDFLWALQNGAIPAGRITSNAGAEKYKPSTSLINCTVSGTIPDSMDGIMNKQHEAALTLKAGCGAGYEFSTLRPKGAFVAGPGANTSGPLTFMDIYDAMCFTVASAGGRRGAQMGTFDISHPDVMDFIKAKHKDGRLRQFNLSLLITDEFIEAVKNDSDWPLVFPISKNEVNVDKVNYDDPTQIVWREWPIHDKYIVNEEGLVACKVYKIIKALNLWNMIMSSTYDYAEPGFILIDRVNEDNNNWFCEVVRATNPCLTGDTLVETQNGKVELINVKVGDLIKTVDGFRPVKTIESHVSIDVYNVTFSNGTVLRATPAHIFHTRLNNESNWNNDKRLDELKIDVDQVRTIVDDVEGFVTIKEIKYAGKKDVYDLFEEVTDTWVTEGIVSRGCGEQPLPPYGACLLGSINLTQFVVNPFTKDAYFDYDRYRKVVSIFSRMLDNVVEINNLPLKKQREEITRKRRHGMGFLGLGSTLTMLQMKYGSDESLVFTDEVSKVMAIQGWLTGLELAKEKGPAPIMDEDFVVTGEMVRKRPEMLDDGYKIGDKVKGKVLHIKYSNYMKKITEHLSEEEVSSMLKHGLRYTHHTSIAPTGTISLSLANNASNGIEPSFSHHYLRNVIKEGQNSKAQVDVFSYELLAYRKFVNPGAMPFDKENPLPDYFTVSDDVSPKQHVMIQAAAQKWIDSSISKTANVPTDYPFEDFKDIYMTAYEEGLKGCTTFRFNPEVFSGVLVKESDLENTLYRFELKNGESVELKGNQKVEYEGQVHVAANLFDALKEGYYGKY